VIIFFKVTINNAYCLSFDKNFKNTSLEIEAYIPVFHINWGLIGIHRQQRRYVFNNECSVYDCNNIGLNFKINLPNDYLLNKFLP
jgi:hypothetical protein